LTLKGPFEIESNSLDLFIGNDSDVHKSQMKKEHFHMEPIKHIHRHTYPVRGDSFQA